MHIPTVEFEKCKKSFCDTQVTANVIIGFALNDYDHHPKIVC
jgi:hypothetical protein